MRITEKELSRQMTHVIGDRNYDMSKLQEQLSTGKRLLSPSDDPVDVANDLKLNTKLKEYTQFKKNINDGISYMNVTDTAMGSMNTLIQRVRELAVEGSNDTTNASNRQSINKEVSQLFRQMVALINTNYKGDFIFSGTQTKTPPMEINQSVSLTTQDYTDHNMSYFNASGLPVGSTVQIFNAKDGSAVKNIIPDSFKLNFAGTNYVENTDYKVDYQNGTLTILNPALAVDATPGTANYAMGQMNLQFDYISTGKDIYGQTISNWGTVNREIESGITSPINITADELTKDYKTGYDLVGTMIRLGQNLTQNNQSGIQNSITEIDSVFSSVLAAQSKNGARTNLFETTLDRNEGQTSSATEIKSSLEDIDFADSVMQYSVMENTYNAALKTAAKIIQPSLVNFL